MSEIVDRGVNSISDRLQNRQIGLGASGGIGVVELVKIIRELRRHGASVFPRFTPSVGAFISPLAVEWAAGRPVITSLEADVDHLDPYDLVLLAPATLNTIAKCAMGICDNSVTLLTAAQIGRKAPVLIVPTMNVQLVHHPMYEEYKKRLESWGVSFFQPTPQEGRLKMPAPEKIAELIIRMLAK